MGTSLRAALDQGLIAIQEDLLRMRAEVFRGFFESAEYATRVEEKVARFPRLSGSYEAFFRRLGGLGVSPPVRISQDQEPARTPPSKRR